jgi:hypothetical protein
MSYGEIIIIIVAVLSLLIGFYQGWRVGLAKGISYGYAIGRITTAVERMPENADK